MTTQIPGKDAPLETTIKRASSSLSALGLELKETHWLNPAPDCWSVHLHSTRCPQLYTNGKGTTHKAALASGLVEFIERLSTDFLFAEYHLDPDQTTRGNDPQQSFYFFPNETYFPADCFNIKNNSISTCFNNSNQQLLSPELFELYNPEKELLFEHLLDNNLDLDDKPIIALPFVDTKNGYTCHFPVSLLNNLYVSNGMAAGNSSTECDAQAISEIIERHVKAIVIAKGISLPDVALKAITGSPRISKIISSLEACGFQIRVKDASLGGQYPVVCVQLIDGVCGGVYAAFGCSCRFETAVERTLTELLQGRTLDQLKQFQAPAHELSQVAEPLNLESHFIDSDGLLCWSMFKATPDFAATQWDFNGSTAEELKQLQKIIYSKGKNIYKAEYKHCSMYSSRIIIPTMSEIYPVEDLVWNNRNTGTELRSTLLKLDRLDHKEFEVLLFKINELALEDQLLVSQVIGVLFDTESSWYTMRMGELKALIYLALGDHHNSYEWCQWCIEFGELPLKKKRKFSLIYTLLGLTLKGHEFGEYDSILGHIYALNEIEMAKNIIAGDLKFAGVCFGNNWTEVSKGHKELLSIYNDLHQAKNNGLA